MRKNCQQPGNCVAGKRGPCRLCSDLSANRERMKRLNADPEFAAAHRERMKRLHADPEFAAANRERSRERMKRLNADPEFAAAHRERMKRLNADPEFAAKLKDAVCVHWTPEMDAALVEMRERGTPVIECAEAIGVSHPVCRKRMDELGLPVTRRRVA